jgi:hypothetical protein
VWLLDSDLPRSADANEQVRAVFTRVTSDPNVWRSITSRFDAELWCGVHLDGENREVWFQPDVLRQLAELGIKLGVDIYR